MFLQHNLSLAWFPIDEYQRDRQKSSAVLWLVQFWHRYLEWKFHLGSSDEEWSARLPLSLLCSSWSHGLRQQWTWSIWIQMFMECWFHNLGVWNKRLSLGLWPYFGSDLSSFSDAESWWMRIFKSTGDSSSDGSSFLIGDTHAIVSTSNISGIFGAERAISVIGSILVDTRSDIVKMSRHDTVCNYTVHC